MPKIDIDKVPINKLTGYPKHFHKEIEGRSRKRIGDAAGLTQFGVNLCRLEKNAQSSHRHWHTDEDEFVLVLEGEVVLKEEDGETVLKVGDAVAWKAGEPNGHTIINRARRPALILEVGTRAKTDKVAYPDIDMAFEKTETERRYTKKNGEPY
jgi:uncharacterized cupin superfamily protein